MKKLYLSTAVLIFSFFGAFAQTASDTTYKSNQLKIDEINLISSYYQQNGNHSAVTGGVGTEKLFDFANVIDLKVSRYDKKYRKHIFIGELGIDTYTSASSDKIDPKTISSASASDVRFYPSISWSVANEKTGNTFGLNASSSTEYDYQSFGIGASYFKKSKDNNTEFGFKAQAYLDNLKQILPIELVPAVVTGASGGQQYPSANRNTFSGSLSLSQVINKRFQVTLLMDLAYQQGFLSLPFHRVYFSNGELTTEKLPSTRFKLPIGLRANYFLDDRYILRSYYRYYIDNWGLNAQNIDMELAVKINPFLSISPFYRYYTQTASKYFSSYKTHLPTETFYSSNYSYSKFQSNFFGAGFRLSPPKGVFGVQRLQMLEIRVGNYNRTEGLRATNFSLNLRFK
ncbi:MAG: DUF3570 domain-containing protein [Daejeonella sp.]